MTTPATRQPLEITYTYDIYNYINLGTDPAPLAAYNLFDFYTDARG